MASPYLANTQITLKEPTTRFADGRPAVPTHDAAYWGKVTQGFDFSGPDRAPADLFNEVLWDGLMHGRPYPTRRSGEYLRSQAVTDAAGSKPQ